jgi:hypothetical protein
MAAGWPAGSDRLAGALFQQRAGLLRRERIAAVGAIGLLGFGKDRMREQRLDSLR